jgi:glycosyltransferase involved in cell wall biosynthesis
VQRIAIVHYWLLGMRGGERVVEALCRLLPEADIFTLFYDPERVSETIRSRVVKTSFLNPARRYYRSLLPLMPLALEHLDLRGYDVVISSESGPAKGVLTSSRTNHICYCHSPMRYLWDLYSDYLHDWTPSRIKRGFMMPLTNYLRLWDYASASRVDEFIANSRNVQDRIWKAYRRRAEVIYPPVPVEEFHTGRAEDYYLIVSELVSYKRIDYVVKHFSQSDKRLKIVGNGPEYRRLRNLASPSVEFCGRVSDDELKGLYAHSRAVLIPGEEDFGLVPVEALASGKPVIALGRGGVLESVPVRAPRAGFFFNEPSEAELQGAIERFENEEHNLSPQEMQLWASSFSEKAFREAMLDVLSMKDRVEPATISGGQRRLTRMEAPTFTRR